MYTKILKKNHGDIKYRKKGCQLSKQAYKWRANDGLCHLLAISGYKVDNINSIENNADIFQDILQLITSIKSKLVKQTVLTETVASAQSNNQNDRQFEETEESLAAQAIGELEADTEDTPMQEENRRRCHSILIFKMVRELKQLTSLLI